MKRYTVGFVFDTHHEKVLLIHKTHPEWQRGKINGPGGKIEENETPHQCVAREIREETGLHIAPEHWTLVAELENDQRIVQFFATVHPGGVEVQSNTDEKAEWCSVRALPGNVIPNLTWLIPLSLDKLQHNKFTHLKLHSQD